MNLLGLYTLAKKESLRFIEVWTQTILSPVVSNLLFLMVFGALFLERTTPFAGVDYLTFLIPGLAVMGFIVNNFQNPSSSLVLAKYTGTIPELLMLPLRGWEMAVAYIVPGIVRGVIVAAVTVAVGAFFIPIYFNAPLVLIGATLLLGILFGSIGVIIGVWAKQFDQMSAVTSFIITPLIYFGGVFYSVASLPAPFDAISKYNPIFYGVDLFRYGFLGVGDAPLGLSFLITGAMALVAFLIAWRIFATGYRLKS